MRYLEGQSIHHNLEGGGALGAGIRNICESKDGILKKNGAKN
jgi:hypothetical protein